MDGDGIVDGLLGTPHLQDSNPHLDKLESDYLYHFGYSKDDKNPSLKERFSDVKVRHLAAHEQPNLSSRAVVGFLRSDCYKTKNHGTMPTKLHFCFFVFFCRLVEDLLAK